ncbi:porin [Janthinobacterium sp. 17J80-10]|uniref:porin n=1 Tax=Janthinobacterium sp. 17J80-10 TaxID=2497863 RepID=UPI0010054286|nr:porin [Janthinobacterium sp. 17J80-10]QAU34537.1 porin [Janthinobacterium sp. 17J80-10]
MKKSLITLAVLGALSPAIQAQTNIRIGGVIQADLKRYKIGNTTRAASTELRLDDDYTSRFWIAGSEDLGGGLSAIFNIENRFTTDQRQSTGLATGAGLADGDTWVGLKGGFGQITLGKHALWSSQGFIAEALLDNGNITAMPTNMTATLTILSYVGGTVISNTRVSNVLRYATPSYAGFTGAAAYSTSANGTEGTAGNAGIGAPAKAYSDGGVFVLTGTYSNGPIYLALAYWDHKREGRPVSSGITVANPAGALLPNAAIRALRVFLVFIVSRMDGKQACNMIAPHCCK